MLSEKLTQALNEQMTFEIYSAYIYKAMEAYFEPHDLKGMANWMNVQTLEELTHAERFFRFINDAGGRARFFAVDEPKFDYKSPLEAFETALGHERLVTSRINKLSDLAIAESNHSARIFLDWFVTEQVEEEANASSIIAKLKMIGDDSGGLMMLDQELSQRVFVPPAPAAAN